MALAPDLAEANAYIRSRPAAIEALLRRELPKPWLETKEAKEVIAWVHGPDPEVGAIRNFMKENAKGISALLKREYPSVGLQSGQGAEVSSWVNSQKPKWYFLWLR